MRKTAIFVEGQGEQLFIRHLLFQVFGYKISFDSYKIHSDVLTSVPYSWGDKDSCDFYFLLVNVQGDTNVLSQALKRTDGLISQKFEQIICLRDMYSEEII